MLTSIKQRLGRDDEQGFTLIELMVVVLIIAILLAIAIPTFLGAKDTANARAAQSNDRNALTAEQTVFTNSQAFSNDVAAGGVLLSAEPNLVWTTGITAPSSASVPNTVAAYLGTSTTAGDTVYLESFGKDGNCYVIQQTNDPAVTTGTTGYGVEKGACSVPAAGRAPSALGVGTGSANKSAAGVFPTFYPAW